MDTTTIDPVILDALRTDAGLVGAAARHAVQVAHQRAIQEDDHGRAAVTRYASSLDRARSSAVAARRHLWDMLAALADGDPGAAAHECRDAERMMAQAHTAMMQARGMLDGIEAAIVAEHRRHMEAGG